MGYHIYTEGTMIATNNCLCSGCAFTASLKHLDVTLCMAFTSYGTMASLEIYYNYVMHITIGLGQLPVFAWPYR